MTAAIPVLRFRVGERTLATVHRRVVRKSWSLAELLDGNGVMPASGADGVLLLSAPASPGMTTAGHIMHVLQRYPRWYARLDTGFEAYLASFSANARSGLLRKRRRFADSPDIRSYRTPGEIAVFHALARDVSKLTYQERLLDAGLPADPAPLLADAARDAARGFLLFSDGKPVAYLYTPVESGVAIYAYLGYDPAFASRSPGAVLQLAAMERLFADPQILLFDFTEGDGQHKRQFATGHVDCADILFLRATVVNCSLVKAHIAFGGFIDGLSAAASRYGLKARLRSLLRR